MVKEENKLGSLLLDEIKYTCQNLWNVNAIGLRKISAKSIRKAEKSQTNSLIFQQMINERNKEENKAKVWRRKKIKVKAQETT